MHKILHTVDIDAPTDDVYEAITAEEGLSRWWTTQVDADDAEGGEIDFTFVPEFNPTMSIDTLEDGEKVVWKCIGGSEEWSKSRFTFHLEDREGATVLFFTQEFATAVDDEDYGRYNFNWGFYLQSLCTYCEKGQGIPFDPA